MGAPRERNHTEQLESIADAVAGDAQIVIGTLRPAARRAIKDGRDLITDEHKIEGLREDILMGETCVDGCRPNRSPAGRSDTTTDRGESRRGTYRDSKPNSF